MEKTSSRTAHPPRVTRESGYSMAFMLILLVVLSLVGAATFQKVRGDIHYTGRDLRHLKAQAVAESAVNWAQETLASPKRIAVFPYTVSTHQTDGVTSQQTRIGGAPNPIKLLASDVPAVYPGSSPAYKSGWIGQTTTAPAGSLTGSNSETISFKVWYPDNFTVRITGKGIVEGVEAQVVMIGDVD